jgi:hypothetical protein
MMVKQRIMRVLGAAIVLIVLSFAPSVVQAHSGHEHHAAAAQAAIHGDHGHAASSESEPAVTPASLQKAEMGQPETPTPSGRNCVGVCCSSAFACCCAAGLPASMEYVPFPCTVTRVSFPPPQTWVSRAPDSLKRPPKHFT